MKDERKPDCYDCGGRGEFCPSQPDKCDGCETCERCNGTGADPGTDHYLTGSVADPARTRGRAPQGGPNDGTT